MSETLSRPPSLATLLVAVCAGAIDREVLLGDLEEEFHYHRESSGETTARRWYWSQALRSAGSLFHFRLSTVLLALPVGGALVGGVTAIVAATMFGLLLETLVAMPSPAKATLPQIAMVVTFCALVSATCGGWAAARMAGKRSFSALAFVAMVVLAPDFIYASRLPDWNPLLVGLPLLAACAGLFLGAGLWRSAQHRPATSGEIS